MGIHLEPTKKRIPTIYAYTTPEIARHDGWTKIGFTEHDVSVRIKQQTRTADILWHLEWQGNAIYDDGSGDCFRDTDFHAYLIDQGIEPMPEHEWFRIDGPSSKQMFFDYRMSGGSLKDEGSISPYRLRDEQEAAVEMAREYFASHEGGSFLWNAKPRFGKTLAAYELALRMDMKNILIFTNRPAIATSWYYDYEKYLGVQSGYVFVSNVDSVRDGGLVISRDDFTKKYASANEPPRCIEFVSLQDIKGSKYFGGEYDKLGEVASINWDILIIDEAHEGVYTGKTDIAFDHINRKATLHLSGTPFKALASDVFASDAIYNWTYADEQRMKRTYVSLPGSENPYAQLPQLNMYTYQMSEIVCDRLEGGIDIDGESYEYAFDLNEFFAVEDGRFKYSAAINKFLEALTTNEKFPYSTDKLRAELKHTVWLLNRVDSAKKLAERLRRHPVFSQYEIVVAAGDGKTDDTIDKYGDSINDVYGSHAQDVIADIYVQDDIGTRARDSYNAVRDAIATHDKTITLTVGQLTTGVTIPEWSAILMLSNIKSPALYMQAAFRVQNPCLYRADGKSVSSQRLGRSSGVYDKGTYDTDFYRKENAYVFDFDPARTLLIFEQFANDLSESTAGGRGDTNARKQQVRELLNFFPVLGEDDDGQMVPLDAEKVFSIPRRIKSKEVVRRGFMSNFLFQNVTGIFGAPRQILEIIGAMPIAKETKALPDTLSVTTQTASELSLNAMGQVEIPEDDIIGRSKEIFGEKVYAPSVDLIPLDDGYDSTKSGENADSYDALKEKMCANYKEKVIAPLLDDAQLAYGSDMTKSTRKSIENSIVARMDETIGKQLGDLKIKRAYLESEKEDRLDKVTTLDEQHDIEKEFDERYKKLTSDFMSSMQESLEEATRCSEHTVVETVEKTKKEKQKNTKMEEIREHLRGFTRTIPSFLMAYSKDHDDITLETFDTIVPDDVFYDVTSITKEQFIFLRDGGDYEDEGQIKHFDGQVFEPTVFDDSIIEFLDTKDRLADYFSDTHEEDIFDYIPPQKNNQIFTPKAVVRDMVDMLEAENPGCFDNPEATFADLYMKSGMYITEIVRRLYRSEKMKQAYPDDRQRLRHIFERQVYGCAPSEIIYRIALSYILGFADIAHDEYAHHIIKLDTLEYAKDGTLEQRLKEEFGIG